MEYAFSHSELNRCLPLNDMLFFTKIIATIPKKYFLYRRNMR
jgi:hypothetical protein